MIDVTNKELIDIQENIFLNVEITKKNNNS